MSLYTEQDFQHGLSRSNPLTVPPSTDPVVQHAARIIWNDYYRELANASPHPSERSVTTRSCSYMRLPSICCVDGSIILNSNHTPVSQPNFCTKAAVHARTKRVPTLPHTDCAINAQSLIVCASGETGSEWANGFIPFVLCQRLAQC